MHDQIIYFGAPGTGKSHIVKEKLASVPRDQIFRVTIHPEYTYSDFIGQLLPEQNRATLSVDFPFKPGPFTNALVKAFDDLSKDVYLVLEEISRGNVAAIFGDVFQLLDRDIHFVSKYPIWNKSIADEIVTISDDIVYLPSNFNIIGTVNVNDQNVFPMDTAFKRRFDWSYVSSNPAIDDHGNIITTLNNPKMAIAVDSIRTNDVDTTWQSFYSALNLFITDNENGLGKKEDKQLGQFFVDFGQTLTNSSHSSVSAVAQDASEKITSIIKNKLLLYLWNDVQGTSSFNVSQKLFANSIRSFDDLYSNYGSDKVFSDSFIKDFLIPDANKYPY